MKKILGIIAAGALIATSVFAADVSAKVKFYGDLFNYNGTDVSLLQLNNHQSHDWEPDFAFSFSDDKAGAAIALKTADEWGSGQPETTTNWNIWFKPFDSLKINLGKVDVALNKETIDWSTNSNVANNAGYGVEFGTGGLSLGLYLDQGFGTPWFTKSGIGQTAFKAAYGADFGTIAALFRFKQVKNPAVAAVPAKHHYEFNPETGLADAKDDIPAVAAKDAETINSIEAGIGYTLGGFVDGLNAFVDGKLVMEGDAKSVVADEFVAYSAGDLTLKVYFAETIGLGDKTTFGLNYKARVDYNLGSNGIYFYSACGDVCALDAVKDGAAVNPITFKPGITGSCGAMSWELPVEMKLELLADKTNFKVSVPVNFTVNF